MSATLLHNVLQRAGELAPASASLLIASVWRGVLLAVVVALALKLLPRLSPSVRSIVWMCVLGVVVVSPLLSLSGMQAAPPVVSVALHFDPRWSFALAGVWVVFSALRLAQLAASAWQLRALAKRSTLLAADENIERILASSGRDVQLCTSTEVDRPSAVGFFFPRILLPDGLIGKVSASELEHIVLHELEHLRRHDDWTNLLQQLSLALLPLHPVVLWLHHRLCRERELACDDGVLRATQSRRSYAACLTNLAERSMLRRGVSLALGALGEWKPKSEVARRVCRILREPEAAMGRTQSRVAAGALLAGVFAGAVALAHTPHFVSFAPQGSGTVAQAAPASVPLLRNQVSESMVAAASSMGHIAVTPRAVLAKAVVVPHASAATFHIPAGKPAMRQAKQRIVSREAAPQPSPLYRLAAWQDDDMPAAHFAFAVQQDSQFTYAAVPVRGGWLIIQI